MRITKQDAFFSLFFLFTLVSLSGIYALENGNTAKEINGITTSSATTQQTPIKKLLKRESYSIPLENRFKITGNKLILGNTVKTGDKILITDMKGKTLFHYIHEVEMSKVTLPRMTPGTYMVTQIRKGFVVSTNRVTVVMKSD